MRKGNNVLRSVAQISQGGNVPLPGVPLIEICDRCRVLVENHQGVIGYDCHEVLVKVRFGVLCIRGDGLYLKRMSKDRLVVTGSIRNVDLRG